MNTPLTDFNNDQFISALVSSKLHLHHLDYFEANLRSSITSSVNISVAILKDRDSFLKKCTTLLLSCMRTHTHTHTSHNSPS